MAESPTPEPSPAAQSGKTAEPKPSRGRRLWRWSKRWGKRFLLLVIVLFFITTAVYSLYRHRAFNASDKALAEARAELDASEPGWRYEDIEVAHNARVPPPDRNSFALIVRLPRIGTVRKPLPEADDEPTKAFDQAHVSNFLRSPHGHLSNELPHSVIQTYVATAARNLPATHPVVIELARSKVGGIRMVATRHAPDPTWADVGKISEAANELEIASYSAAIDRDDRAAVAYALAALNAGRAFGDMPRMLAQRRRMVAAERAARIATRMVAWGEPIAPLDELQHELLAESNTDWLTPALRGERAVLNRTVPEPTAAAEWADTFRVRDDGNPEPTQYVRAILYAVRPYRERRRADGLREATRAIQVCAQPIHERLGRFSELEMERRKNYEATASRFTHWWQFDLSVVHRHDAAAECRTVAQLRTVAVGLACERFRQVHNRWPHSLAELPASLLTPIPSDPYDGKPLRYKLLDDGAVVYSVGSNRLDNEGEIVTQTSDGQLDVGIRLWNPALRGLPPKDLDVLPAPKPDPDAP